MEEACSILATSAPTPIAGATDLLVHWPTRIEAHEKSYLDLSALSELRSIRWTDSELILGALTTYWDVIRDERISREFPLLPLAARQVGGVQIQTRGTWAGNIINASPAADGVPVLMAYDAMIDLRSTLGGESFPLTDFYLGYKKMRRAQDQLVTAIRIPRQPYDFAYFEKVGARRAQLITKVGIAISHSVAGWRVVANSVAPTVCRCRAIEALLASDAPLQTPADLYAAIDADVTPIDDIRSTKVYRREVLARLIYHALSERRG